MTSTLSTEVADEYRDYLTTHQGANNEADKALHEVNLVLAKTMEELEVVIGQVETPLTREGATKVVKAYLELPKPLQIAEASVNEGEAAVDPWKSFIAMISEEKAENPV